MTFLLHTKFLGHLLSRVHPARTSTRICLICHMRSHVIHLLFCDDIPNIVTSAALSTFIAGEEKLSVFANTVRLYRLIIIRLAVSHRQWNIKFSCALIDTHQLGGLIHSYLICPSHEVVTTFSNAAKCYTAARAYSTPFSWLPSQWCNSAVITHIKSNL